MIKYDLIKEVLIENNADVWILFNDEKCDSIFEKYICDKTLVAAYAIVSKTCIHLVIHELEADNIDKELYSIHVYNSEDSLLAILNDVLKSLDWPQNIYLNYTTKNDVKTDTLGFGIYTYVTNNINKIYKNNNKEVLYLSAENIIYSLFNRKTELTIARMQYAANIALEILEETFKNLQPGLTELDIVSITHNIYKKFKDKHIKNDIVDIDYSWKESFCPIVLVGPSLQKGGHAIASKQLLERGHTIYFDFGVKLKYSDGEQVASDIQRMGYLLKKTEKAPPLEVQQVFNTLVESIDIVIKAIKPKIKGYEIDSLVRQYILSNGYPDYNHATGHSIGEEAHSPGAVLGRENNKLANLEIQNHGVYTIEPRIAVYNGGSIEEMVYVTKDGGISLSKRQDKLYIID